MADITLSAGVRSNLLSLTQTEKQMTKTNYRLATGKRVNEAIDNPSNYFASLSLTDRAKSLNARIDGIGQAIQTLKTAEIGVNAVRTVFSQMQATIQQALEEPRPEVRRDFGRQFNELMEQAQEIAKDSTYAGVNLLQGNETLTVQFNERFDQSIITLKGMNLVGPGLQADGNNKTRNNMGEVPPSSVQGRITLGPIASFASVGSQASVASRASLPPVASIASQPSLGSVASRASVTSQSAIASRASAGAIGTWPSVASVASQGSVTSQASIASRYSIAAVGSAGSRGGIQAVRSQPSVPAQASIASMGSHSRPAQFAFTLNVSKSDIGTNKVLGIKGYGLDQLAPPGHEVDWGGGDFKEQLKNLANDIEKFDEQLKMQLSNIAANVSVLTIREEFTQELMSTLNTGSDKLVLADMNTEGANLLALQTRQQLGIQALSLASQQAQQVLRMLG